MVPSRCRYDAISSPLLPFFSPLHGNRPCRLPIPLGPPVQQDVRLWPVNRIVHPPPALLHPQRPGERTKRLARVSGRIGSRERTSAEITTHRHSVSDISLPFGTWRTNERTSEQANERANKRTSERTSLGVPSELNRPDLLRDLRRQHDMAVLVHVVIVAFTVLNPVGSHTAVVVCRGE